MPKSYLLSILFLLIGITATQESIAQSVSNCNIIEVSPGLIWDPNSTFPLDAEVDIDFNEDCGCSDTSNCKLLRVYLPSKCFGVQIKIQGVNSDPDYFDLYRPQDCNLLSFDSQFGNNSAEIASIVPEQEFGYYDVLICEGSDDTYTDQAFKVNIRFGDLCHALPIPNDSICIEENKILKNIKGNVLESFFHGQGNGDVYLSNNSANDTYFGSSLFHSSSDADIAIGKNWNIFLQFEGDNKDALSEIQVHEPTGDIYVTGSYKSTTLKITSSDGNAKVLSNSNPGVENGFVAKFNENFELQWAFSIGENWVDQVRDLTIIGVDEFAITGITRHSIDFDPDPNRNIVSAPSHGISGFVAKYSPNGALPKTDWARTIFTQDSKNNSVLGLGITHDNDGNIYAVGTLKLKKNTAINSNQVNFTVDDFNPSWAGTDITTNTGIASLIYEENDAHKLDSYAGYIVRYNNDGSLQWYVNPYDQAQTGTYKGDVRDIVFDGESTLYYSGDDAIGKINKDLYHIGESYSHLGMDLYELSIDKANKRIGVIGLVNNLYRNHEVKLAPGTGSQISRPADYIFSLYDYDFNHLYSLNPGSGGYDIGLSISMNEHDHVLIDGRIHKDPFNADYPLGNKIFNKISSDPNMTDYYIGLYEIICIDK